MGRTDRRQVEQLFRTRYPQLCRAALAIVRDRDRAEDIVMDAFSRLLDTPTVVRDKPGYLYRSVINGCLNDVKRAGNEGRANQRHRAQQRINLDRPDGDHLIDVNDPIWVAMGRLPRKQRAVLVLRLVLDLPEKQVAEILECSVGTVKSQFHKARQGLIDGMGAADRDCAGATEEVSALSEPTW